jgi:NitT/TauT family transport system permease protein
MTRRHAALIVRSAILASLIALLELGCRFGLIDTLTVLAPSDMVASMVDQVGSGELNASIATTFSTIVMAFVIAVVLGTSIGALIHRFARLRDVADPLPASARRLWSCSAFSLRHLRSSSARCQGSTASHRS